MKLTIGIILTAISGLILGDNLLNLILYSDVRIWGWIIGFVLLVPGIIVLRSALKERKANKEQKEKWARKQEQSPEQADEIAKQFLSEVEYQEYEKSKLLNKPK
ncbi:MAG: hypothetical protein WC560_10740 [Syntrophales bacterium]